MKGALLEPGTKVRITANLTGHRFMIGDECSVVESARVYANKQFRYEVQKDKGDVTSWIWNDEIELVKGPKIETGCLVLGIIVVLFWFFVGAIIYAAF